MISILATSVAMSDTLQVICKTGGNTLQIMLSIIAAIVSISMFIVAWVTFREHNRPYITFNIEADLDGNQIFYFVRNTGIRGARDVKIHINPTPKPYGTVKSPKDKDRDEFNYAFLAPDQTIRTVFDYGNRRYPKNGKQPDIDSFHISITYRYNKRIFKEEYDCDISYLQHIINPPTQASSITVNRKRSGTSNHIRDI